MKGKQLESIRVAMGVTKVYLADKLGISRPTLDIKLITPSLFTIAEMGVLCSALKISKSAFL